MEKCPGVKAAATKKSWWTIKGQPSGAGDTPWHTRLQTFLFFLLVHPMHQAPIPRFQAALTHGKARPEQDLMRQGQERTPSPAEKSHGPSSADKKGEELGPWARRWGSSEDHGGSSVVLTGL